MKIRKILTAFLIVMGLFFSLSLVVKAEEDIDLEKNAHIYSRTLQDSVPIYHVKDSEVATYLYEDEEVYDFRRHFYIIDQRMDILNMNYRVDGAPAPIDEGGYVWDFGGFTTETVGDYTITISYEGANGVTVSSSVVLTVIETDEEAPKVYGLFATVNMDIGSNFVDNIQSISVVDNVDGLILLTLDNFEGHEEIDNNLNNASYEITLRVSDKAGNEVTQTFTVIIKDMSGPVILNTKNIETRVNKAVDYKSHITVTDNHTPADKIVVEFQFVTDETGDTVIEGMTEIDFSKVGETYVKVIATDEGGAQSTRLFRVIVKDSTSLPLMLIYINAALFAVALIAIGTFAIVSVVRNKKTKPESETPEEVEREIEE